MLIRLMCFVRRKVDRRRIGPYVHHLYPGLDVPTPNVDRGRAAEAVICAAVECGVIPYREIYQRRHC